MSAASAPCDAPSPPSRPFCNRCWLTSHHVGPEGPRLRRLQRQHHCSSSTSGISCCAVRGAFTWYLLAVSSLCEYSKVVRQALPQWQDTGRSETSAVTFTTRIARLNRRKMRLLKRRTLQTKAEQPPSSCGGGSSGGGGNATQHNDHWKQLRCRQNTACTQEPVVPRHSKTSSQMA